MFGNSYQQNWTFGTWKFPTPHLFFFQRNIIGKPNQRSQNGLGFPNVAFFQWDLLPESFQSQAEKFLTLAFCNMNTEEIFWGRFQKILRKLGHKFCLEEKKELWKKKTWRKKNRFGEARICARHNSHQAVHVFQGSYYPDMEVRIPWQTNQFFHGMLSSIKVFLNSWFMS